MPKKKILVLMKRFGSNKDMVKENFGREIRLFEQLGKKYEIDMICPDFHLKEKFHLARKGINYHVVPVGFICPFSMFRIINNMIKKRRYDAIIPTSEPI